MKISKNKFEKMLCANIIICISAIIICLSSGFANIDYKRTNEILRQENIVKKESINKLEKQVEQLQKDVADAKNELNRLIK